MAKAKSKYVKGPKGKTQYEAHYVALKKGERVFLLVHPKSSKGHAYESAAAAKKDGWKKI